jgi:hypothetical protein
MSYNKLLYKTSFLNKESNVELYVRLWCVLNDITMAPICSICNKPIKINKHIISLNNTRDNIICSKSCLKKHKTNIYKTNNTSNSVSYRELSVYNFVKFYNNNTINSALNIIPPYELDVYIPDKKIAIEFDGLFYHSHKNGKKHQSYHLQKTLLCSTKSIRLIHLFEDEWIYKNKLVKSRIKDITNNFKYSIDTTKCDIKYISNDDLILNKFICKYYLGDYAKCDINVGLYYKNRLISVLGINKIKSSKNQYNEFQICLYCSINNFNINNGLNLLIQNFENKYNPNLIKVNVDKRWSIPNTYINLGFKVDLDKPPNYWYTNKNACIRVNKHFFKHDTLKIKLPIYNSKLNDWDNITNNGWDKIWDCGNYVFYKTY